VSLDVADYHDETGDLAIRRAKGRKDRLSYATSGLADALKDWIRVRGNEEGPLFCGINKSGRITIRRLTDQAVLHILRKRAGEAGVSPFSERSHRLQPAKYLLDPFSLLLINAVPAYRLCGCRSALPPVR
jgi:integrase